MHHGTWVLHWARANKSAQARECPGRSGQSKGEIFSPRLIPVTSSSTLCRRLSDVSLYRWYWPMRPHATARACRRPTRRHPRRRCLLLPPPHLSRIWYPLRLCNCPPLYQRTTRSSVFCFTRVEHRNVFYFHSWMTQFSLLRVTTNAVAPAPARRRSRPAHLSHSRHAFPLV